MKYLYTIFLLFFIKIIILSQTDYKRSSMTLLLLDFKENHGTLLSNSFSKIQPAEKYFNNNIKDNLLIPDFKRIPVTKGMEFIYFIPDQDIITSLKTEKVAQKILSIWFHQQSNGSFDTEVLKERGLYNANDNDYIIASSSKRGNANLMDMGLNLVNQSYVLVFDFFEVQTLDEYYVKKEIPTDKRLSNGFKAKVRCYLYKLDFGENTAQEFFQKLWITTNDPDKSKKISAFQNTDFSFEVISNHYTEVEASQTNPSPNSVIKQKSKEELMDNLVNSVMENVNVQIENKNKDLRVKAMVMDTRPIASKIGKKEGLGFDQRYFVYENRMKKNGNVYQKRIAVVKSMKVADNRKITSGDSEPSLFYQIAGRKVDNMGMYLEQKNDAGLNLFLGYNYKGMTGASARLEFYISKLMGDLVESSKSAKAFTSLKMYMDIGYGIKDYPYENWMTKYTFTKISLGLNKDFYPLKFIHWGLYLGYGLEFAEWTDSEDQIESDFIETGINVGMNLSYRVQLMWSYNYKFLISSKLVDKEKVDPDIDFNYKEVFNDRMGQGASIGLRFMF
jgi:hypothetical protein